jgi:hypothetical protein
MDPNDLLQFDTTSFPQEHDRKRSPEGWQTTKQTSQTL